MTDINDKESERRQSFRLDMEKELVDIVWTDDQGHQHQKKIACLDFSRGGLRMDCDQPIDVSAEVTIIFKAANPNSQRLYGRVLRCNKQNSGWFEIALRLND
ncbi:MAG: PilZ domain-containing protein [Colwellia sp.]|nr:PilZ domain-containing protein [Colwellia sp.]